jgi:hypothetical protein
MATQKLILQYHYSEDCTASYDIIKSFEYSSKEQFILDIIDNPRLLESFQIWQPYEYELPECFAELIDEIQIYTLEEWFEKNLIKL